VTSRGRSLLALVASLLATGRAGAGAARPVDIGQPLPAFEATALSGQAFSLETALRDHKAIVVLFLSTVCPYARYFASHVRELDERYGPRGVLFVGVNPNRWETKDEVAEQAQKDGYGFPMIKDEHHVIADLLGARATPEAFLVDSEGRLRYRGWVKSRQESPDLQRALDDVLAGRAVRKPETKAFGCAVDRN